MLFLSDPAGAEPHVLLHASLSVVVSSLRDSQQSLHRARGALLHLHGPAHVHAERSPADPLPGAFHSLPFPLTVTSVKAAVSYFPDHFRAASVTALLPSSGHFLKGKAPAKITFGVSFPSDTLACVSVSFLTGCSDH